MNEPYDIIQTVRLTEKATLLSEKQNKYVFRVHPRANKIRSSRRSRSCSRRRSSREHLQLRRQEEARTHARHFGRKAHWKKAIVTLKEGDKIELV